MGFEIRDNHHAFNKEWDLEGWVVGCTIRNPFDVLVSWFYNKPREESFDLWLPRFLSECHYFDNHLMFYGQPYATHVLKFENLQNGFNSFCDGADLPRMIIPHRNVSEKPDHRHYVEYYSLDGIKLVQKRFHDDFVNGNYRLPLRT